MREMGAWTALVMLLVVGPAVSATAYTVTESWEGAHTVLGMYGSGDPPLFAETVAGPPAPVDGERTLRLVHNSADGTPTGYVAWIVGLQDGDIVSASVWRYDVTPGGAPSCRLGAHWNDDPTDVDVYSGAAGWNEDTGPGTGWDEVSWEWTCSDAHVGLVVEVRVYSDPGDTVWVDALSVSAPDHAWIWLPAPPTAIGPSRWSRIKALFAGPSLPEVAN